MGLLDQVSDECGIAYQAEYDKAGRLIKEKSRGDVEKKYEYDNASRIKSVFYGGELVETYSYEEYGKRLSVKDGNNNEYLYNYDDYGRLSSEYNRLGDTQSYSYDDAGQLKAYRDFNDDYVSINLSRDNRIRTIQYSDEGENRFVYDIFGNVLEAENTSGKELFRYDTGGYLIYQQDLSSGEELQFEYDNAGNRIRLKSKSLDISYLYGKNNEVKEIFDSRQKVSVQFKYNELGLETLRIFGNGTKEETLYDKAGRIIVKMQKNERSELLWGQAYLYGIDGKRIASADNLGRITLFEYNKKGQLAAVHYPYTADMEKRIKDEAAINGLPVNREIGENEYLLSDIKSGLIPLLNSMQYGLANKLPNMQTFIKEEYVYDKNGNIKAKTTRLGKIEYNYDAENRLLSSGARDNTFVNYTYDKAGNLLTESSALKTIKYAYNLQNRLIYCEVLDRENKSYMQSSYSYDAFGRRVYIKDMDENLLRNIYDGLSLDIIEQAPVYRNGSFTSGDETSFLWSKNGRPTGGRYRYLGEDVQNDGNRYYYLDESIYKKNQSRYQEKRTLVSYNSSPLIQNTNDGPSYFSTDLLGSVTSITDAYGSIKETKSYDAFGCLVHEDPNPTYDYGFLGKQYDPVSSLYNFGYRDYNPQISRFTTQDPIRDGNNWYAYCGGDPVNFIDLWGLELTLTLNKKDLTLEVVYKVDGKIQDVLFVKGNNDNLLQSKITTAVKSWDNTVDVDTTRTTNCGNNPKRMPDGEWKLTGIKQNPTNNKNYGETWITTDAHQQEPYPDGTSKDGAGYQIHLTSTTNTDGCLGIHDKQLMNQLIDFYCKNEDREPGTAKLIVKNR